MQAARRPDPEVLQALRVIWPAPGAVRFEAMPRPWARATRYVVLPTPQRASLLLPTSPQRVSARTLLNYKSVSSGRARLRARILAGAGAVGLPRILPGTIVIDRESLSLIDRVEELLGCSVHVGIHLGPRRANRKPVLQVFNASGRVVAFAKVGVNDLTRSRVSVEAEALATLARREPPNLVVPTVLAAERWGDCTLLLLTPVPTNTSGEIDGRVRVGAMREVAQLTRTEVVLRESGWWNAMATDVARLASSPVQADLESATRWISVNAGDSRILVGSAHGDWTSWNMATSHGRAVVWDWEQFAEDVPVGVDALHYAFQTAVRLDGQSPRAALIAVRGRAEELVLGNGGSPGQGELVLALYLLHLGHRFLRDGQAAAGAKKGPLDHWLLPALRLLIRDMGRGS